MVVSVTGAHKIHVSCFGWVDRHEDGLFRKDVNIWGNVFSNETALFRMSDGSIARINEFRRIGHPAGERINLYGTRTSFEEQVGSRVWVTKKRKETEDLRGLLACTSVAPNEAGGMAALPSSDSVYHVVSCIHPIEPWPRELLGLPNGQFGSRQFLVDDFVKPCVSGEQPPNNVREAACYLIPGLIAHESACRGGVLLEVPDFGDPPR